MLFTYNSISIRWEWTCSGNSEHENIYLNDNLIINHRGSLHYFPDESSDKIAEYFSQPAGERKEAELEEILVPYIRYELDELISNYKYSVELGYTEEKMSLCQDFARKLMPKTGS